MTLLVNDDVRHLLSSSPCGVHNISISILTLGMFLDFDIDQHCCINAPLSLVSKDLRTIEVIELLLLLLLLLLSLYHNDTVECVKLFT